MAITSLRGNNTPLLSRLRLLLNHQQRLAHTFSEGPQPRPKMVPESVREEGLFDMSKWRKMNASVLGITNSMIPASSITVLRILRREGYEAYLVGGCVRDLILKRVPKDFDVITTANLKQIKRHFHRAQIVGKRFPICMVYIKGSIIEVSSFETVGKDSDKEELKVSKMPKGCDKKDFMRWENSMRRDFTINSLFFDPLSNKVYDYANGMADLRSLKLRSLVPAKLSFQEDCARILRGLRIAARLSLSISKETETAIYKCSSSILNLATGRIMMEMNYMLSYGAAEPSLCLLWRFNLLRLLLPIHAVYLDQQSGRKFPQNSTMLMKLFSNLDKVVTVDRPSDCSLWVALLVLHMALVSHPQDAFVVFTFASILYHGECRKGLKFARGNAQVLVDYIPEILPEISSSSASKSDEQLENDVSRLASIVLDSIAALTATESLVERMSKYPESPCPGLVFVPKKTAQGVAEIFRVLADESYNRERKSYKIDYPSLQKGYLDETRFVLGKIILETMSSSILEEDEVVQEEDYRHLEQETIEENCRKGRKRSRPRRLKPDTDELKPEFAKKHKLVEKILSEQGMDLDKHDVATELISFLGQDVEKHLEMEKKQQCVPPDKTTRQRLKTVKKKRKNIVDDISESPGDRQVTDKENGSLSSLFKDVAADKGEKSSEFRLSSLFKKT